MAEQNDSPAQQLHPEPNDFLRLARQRRSCRSYDPTRTVPASVIDYCLEAAQCAPSACNRKPWHFTIVREQDLRENICHSGLLPGIQHQWLEDAPVIVVLSITPEAITHRIAPRFSKVPYAFVDAGIAGEHFILAATEQGIGTCWVGWIRQKALRKILNLERKQHIVALIATGYPRDQSY